MTRAARLFAFLILAFASGPALADGLRVRIVGGLNGGWSDATSLDTSLGFQNRTTRAGSARLMWNKTAGDFRFEVHSHVTFADGDDVAYATALAPFLPATVPSTLFDLSTTWYSSTSSLVTNTIDRLSVSYTTPNMVFRVGRQAITWGSGMVFHPGDIVAPFSPSAVDTSYKTGADMVYAQYLFENGADIQAIAVPRGTSFGGPIMYDASTYAIRARAQIDSLDGSLMFSRDRGDSVASLGLSGALGGASWNAEYVHWVLDSGATHPSWLFNITNFGTLGDWNISYFAEYYHNGFGVDASTALNVLPASLTKRMSTGQVFYAGRDFLSLGSQLQMTADLSMAPTAVISLNDRSALVGMAVNYTLGDNTNLVFNYFQPLGPDGSEFGGRETVAGSGIYVGQSRSAAVQLVHFF